MLKRRFVWTWVALAGIAAGVFLNKAFPWLVSHLPACSIRRWTGWNCPGCGGTRCARRLLDGDLPGALAMNLLVVLLALLAAVWLVHAAIAEWRGKRVFVPPAWTGWSLLGLIVIFTIARNMSSWPFTLLAPH
ncbi:MAG TPA: DUF2752 domain-containing protein [Luteolibacter sp.]